jgi:hypothetical protein
MVVAVLCDDMLGVRPLFVSNVPIPLLRLKLGDGEMLGRTSAGHLISRAALTDLSTTKTPPRTMQREFQRRATHSSNPNTKQASTRPKLGLVVHGWAP